MNNFFSTRGLSIVASVLATAVPICTAQDTLPASAANPPLETNPPLTTNPILATNPPLVSTTTTPVMSTSNPPLPLATVGPGLPCTPSSTQCGDGFFCSSTSGSCEALTCSNWAKGIIYGQLAFSEAPCKAEFPDANNYFCGWDGNCYEYNCNDWYTYGPVEMTGFDPALQVPLVCNDYNNGNMTHMNSVVFGCRPYQPGSVAPEGKNWVHYFNEECIAQPRAGSIFTCYQNRELTNFSAFETETKQVDAPPECDPDIYGTGTPERASFWYQIMLRTIRKGVTTNYRYRQEDTATSNLFDASKASKTMFAKLESLDDIPIQNGFPLPSAPPPTSTDDSGGNSSGESSDTPTLLASSFASWPIAILLAVWLELWLCN